MSQCTKLIGTEHCISDWKTNNQCEMLFNAICCSGELSTWRRRRWILWNCETWLNSTITKYFIDYCSIVVHCLRHLHQFAAHPRVAPFRWKLIIEFTCDFVCLRRAICINWACTIEVRSSVCSNLFIEHKVPKCTQIVLFGGSAM